MGGWTTVLVFLSASLLGVGCGHESPTQEPRREETTSVPATAGEAPAEGAAEGDRRADPAVGDVPDRCTSDADCSARLAICPHPSLPNLAICIQPTVPGEGRQPGTCGDEVRCQANTREECEALVARCLADPRDARWEETLPRFHSEGDLAGQCYVTCGGWPALTGANPP